MNTQEVKFILQAYRPNGEDASDPHFAEALAQAKLNPELAKWFAEQLAFDAAASRALKEVKVPQHLRESILAGRRVAEPTFWWQQPVWWAMAAVFLVVLGIAGFWFKSNNSAIQFASFRNEMVRVAETSVPHLEFQEKDPAKIQALLASQGVDANYVMPVGLRGLPGMGCKVVNWDGNKVAMICYKLQGTNHVDLFVAEANAFKGSIPGGKPQFVATGRNTTASWSQADKVYVMVGHGQVDEKLLKKYIEPQAVDNRLGGPELVSAYLSLAQARGGL